MFLMLFYKKKIGKIKLMIYPGKANPSPPIGSTLGQKGLNILKFCKDFNNITLNFNKDLKIPVLINYYSDKTYDFLIKRPSVYHYLKNFLNIRSFLDNDLKIEFLDFLNIVKHKLNDFNTTNLHSNLKTIGGVLKSIKINFINDY